MNSPVGTSSSIVGVSSSVDSLRKLVTKLAATSASVLITGESGVGKELVAKALHTQSARRNMPFIAVNCTAIHPGILESELFGHGRGAFTGAIRAHAGYFEQADGGTLFLDEVGDMPIGMQAKLLRVLQEGEVRRMGEMDSKRVDVRLISATNTAITKKVDSGTFRRDLYFRINVVEIRVPSLRERSGDILPLLGYFYRKRGMYHPHILETTRSLLERYSWPGNVRELENEVDRLLALYGEHDVLRVDMLSERIRFWKSNITPLNIKRLYAVPLSDAVGELEQDILQRTLERTGWNKSRAARELGLSRQGLLKKIKRYGLTPPSLTFKDDDDDRNSGENAP